MEFCPPFQVKQRRFAGAHFRRTEKRLLLCPPAAAQQIRVAESRDGLATRSAFCNPDLRHLVRLRSTRTSTQNALVAQPNRPSEAVFAQDDIQEHTFWQEKLKITQQG